MHSPDRVAVPGETAPSADDRKAWRDHVRTRHAVADFLRQFQRFWRRAGLDDLQRASNHDLRLWRRVGTDGARTADHPEAHDLNREPET
jgi:hypothetical protein